MDDYLTEPTDPLFCDCDHEGLSRPYHAPWCLMRVVPSRSK